MRARDRSKEYFPVVRYYETLTRKHSWLRFEQCWAVVIPNERLLSDHAIAERLTLGADHEIRRGHVGEYVDSDVIHISRAHLETRTSLFEIGYHASRSDILWELSKDSKVYSLYWNIEANNRLIYASDGHILLSVDIFEPDEWPPNARETLDELQVFEFTDDPKVAAMAVIELCSGVRLTSEWLDGVDEGFVFHRFPFRGRITRDETS